ncbi:TetR/AcrR family transcriptional regulator [uncultured Methylobacterium sp.]|jgi:AcrR family transcriptional regulator|uniref:TetR/AcrR family transcriptional regulator n=1 Tax=uncultured Methylobacterium sp. TaxID=157278 RepID=UPI002639E18D|nr:TetR/AcrR family transcriptional regulator [uncultured Methylobacterium sp.]
MAADVKQKTSGAQGSRGDVRSNARSDILGAAEEVVAALGAQALTLDAVYRQAGVSKGGLLYHFPSKEALLQAMVERYITRCVAQETEFLREIGEDARGAGSRAAIAQVAADDPGADRLSAALLAAVATDLEYLAPLRGLVRQRFDDMKRSDLPFETAAIIELAVNGLALFELLRLPPLTPEDRHHVLVTLDRMAGGSGDLPEAGSRPSSPLNPGWTKR